MTANATLEWNVGRYSSFILILFAFSALFHQPSAKLLQIHSPVLEAYCGLDCDPILSVYAFLASDPAADTIQDKWVVKMGYDGLPPFPSWHSCEEKAVAKAK